MSKWQNWHEGCLVTTGAEDWGGIIGVTWMACYWMLIIPVWMHVILRVLAAA